MAHFARHPENGSERSLRFIHDLPTLQARYLREAAPARDTSVAGSSRAWRTVRIRPEVLSIVEGLQARASRNAGVQLTISEVLAAILIVGVPEVASQATFGR